MEKDFAFVLSLLDPGLLDRIVLRERAELLPDAESVRRERVLAWLETPHSDVLSHDMTGGSSETQGSCREIAGPWS